MGQGCASVAADQLRALLGPDSISAGVNPCRPHGSAAVGVATIAVSRPTHDGGVAVASQGVSVFQGESVALSGDGNTAIVGGAGDNAGAGAAWVFAQGPTLQVTPTNDMVAAGMSNILCKGLP